MSAVETSYSLTADSQNNVTVPVYKYLDLDSTYRNRNNYPNQNDFVVPLTYPGRGSTNATAVDPVILAIPYSGGLNSPGTNVLQAGSTTTSVVLDITESIIDNFYINSVLEIGGEFRTITSYNGTTKIAVVSVAFSAPSGAGTVYYTRLATPFYVGAVAAAPAPTITSFAITGSPSFSSNNSTMYVRFTSGVNINLVFLVLTYDSLTKLITVSGMPNIPGIGDAIELDSFSRDNASTLINSGIVNSSQNNSYYEIELCWLSIPNKVLNVSYGGKIDQYPYVYVNLYNEGKRLYNQVMFSNNPNSSLALFKVPVCEYYGDTSFITLKDAKTKQIVRFETNSDIRFTITLPNGEIVSYAETDTLSPLAPNSLMQVNALFSLRKLT